MNAVKAHHHPHVEEIFDRAHIFTLYKSFLGELSTEEEHGKVYVQFKLSAGFYAPREVEAIRRAFRNERLDVKIIAPRLAR